MRGDSLSLQMVRHRYHRDVAVARSPAGAEMSMRSELMGQLGAAAVTEQRTKDQCNHDWRRVGGDPSVGVGDYYECRTCGEQKPDERPWDRDADE